MNERKWLLKKAEELESAVKINGKR
jgi:hypothetical protein